MKLNDKTPLILVVNDDGFDAPGIKALSDVAKKFGKIIVVAPEKGQSGKSHSITINEPIYWKKKFENEYEIWYTCSGTPVDCVKLALDQLLPRKPDVCVSGINHGANSSINVFYSGTMGAAIEAGIEGVNSVGFSLHNFSWDADFGASKKVAYQVIQNILKFGITNGTVLNINIPNIKLVELKGIRVCHQAKSKWVESYEERTAPMGHKYYWLHGNFEIQDPSDDSDEHVLQEGFASIVPISIDITNYKAKAELLHWEKNFNHS